MKDSNYQKNEVYCMKIKASRIVCILALLLMALGMFSSAAQAAGSDGTYYLSYKKYVEAETLTAARPLPTMILLIRYQTCCRRVCGDTKAVRTETEMTVTISPLPIPTAFGMKQAALKKPLWVISPAQESMK